MAIANPRVHIICGICGSKDDMNYKIRRNSICENEGEDNEVWEDGVFLYCNNCSSLSGLDELMEKGN